jgi:dihydrofolate reductase
MRRIVAITNVTLDGVMQAPGRPDEDVRGGFEYGGWAQPYMDSVLGAEMGKGMAEGGPLLFGRRTYQDFAAHWPHQTDGNPYTEVLNNAQKYVVSTTLSEPLPWVNSTLLNGDLVRDITALKAEPGRDIGVLGCGKLLRSLIRHRLVDEYKLLIHPLVLGHGTRLFGDNGSYSTLELVDSVPTTTGVIIATYRPVS